MSWRKNIIPHCLSTRLQKATGWTGKLHKPSLPVVLPGKGPRHDFHQRQLQLNNTWKHATWTERPGQGSNISGIYSQCSRYLLVDSLYATRIHLFHLIIPLFCSVPIFLDFFFGSSWSSLSLPFSLFSHKTTTATLTYKPWKTAPKPLD